MANNLGFLVGYTVYNLEYSDQLQRTVCKIAGSSSALALAIVAVASGVGTTCSQMTNGEDQF